MNSNQKIRNDPTLGGNIRRIRKERNLTQDQMVARLQLYEIAISRSIYSQIECGTYNVRVTWLAAIARILQTDYNEFFRGIEIPEPV